MANGATVAPDPQSRPQSQGGVRLEVGENKWAAIASTPFEPPFEPTSSEDVGPGYRLDIGSPPTDADLAYRDDPRDVPFWKPAAWLRWAADNLPWRERERQVLLTLWMEDGEVGKTASLLKIQTDRIQEFKLRVKSEVRQAARWADWEDRWSRERLPGAHVPSPTRMVLAPGHVWFLFEDSTREV